MPKRRGPNQDLFAYTYSFYLSVSTRLMLNMTVVKITIAKCRTEGSFNRPYNVVSVGANFDGIRCAVITVIKHAFFNETFDSLRHNHHPHSRLAGDSRLYTNGSCLCWHGFLVDLAYRNRARKLCPTSGAATLKYSATVAPRSAKVLRSPRSTKWSIVFCQTTNGTHSRVWSVPSVVGSQP